MNTFKIYIKYIIKTKLLKITDFSIYIDIFSSDSFTHLFNIIID